MRRNVVLLVAAIALLPATVSAADWPTYHGDNTRQGNDTSSPGLGSPVVAWTSVALDGNIYGQPVVVGAQVIVATENNTVYSLNPADGSVQWSNHLAAPRVTFPACGNIRPLGITGTPLVDGGNVYVVAEVETSSSPLTLDFQLASLSLATGATNWMHSIAPPDPNWANVVQFEQQRGALLATNGRIIVPLGGLYGDCGSYHGYVLSYAENNTGSVGYWASADVPGIPGDNGAGMWATGGLSMDASGFVYAATGNSNQTTSTSPYDYSDSVIKLNPGALTPGAPVDYFAPGNWYADNAVDSDLGGMGAIQLPNYRVMIVGKSGFGYLLDAGNLGHVGGQLAINRACNASADAAFGSMAYANGVVYVGCSDGLTALQINGTSTNFSTLWHNGTNVADHPPTLAGGLVWSITPSNSTLIAFNPADGAMVTSFSIGGSTHFTTPTAANNQLYVGAGTQVHAFKGSGGPAPCTPQPGPRLVADFNGDGKADLATVGSTGTCVLLSTGTAFAAPAAWASVPFYGNVTTLAGDITGTGKAALVAVNTTSTFVMTSTGTGFNAPAQWSNLPFYGTRGTFLADVNGDGKADLVAINDTSVWVMLSTGSGFAAPTQWSNVPFYGNVTTTVGDVAGTGRAALVAVNTGSTWVMTSTGSGFAAPAQWSNIPFYGNLLTMVADVNGDKKADLVAINGGSIWVMTSTGTGFAGPAQWLGTAFNGQQATLPGDVNGDLKADLVAVNNVGIWVVISSGAGFAAPSMWYSGPA